MLKKQTHTHKPQKKKKKTETVIYKQKTGKVKISRQSIIRQKTLQKHL